MAKPTFNPDRPLSGNTVQLRLIGAKTYVNPPLGIGVSYPVEVGDVIEAPAEYAGHLLGLTWREGKHGVHPVFTDDLDRPIKLRDVGREIPIGEDDPIAEALRKAEERAEAAEKAAKAAQEREAAILARVEALETAKSEEAQAAPKKPSRRRKADTKAA